ncbi:MAG: tRNA (adenosine(37)-N6)-threonylcarbamoyltransferase complex transferase subunit TsaD [Bacilli bacterium]|nr:tRNA (adenosine(37)-N6)-threonylcarbamoyltransferase complex transferase subunit TsaD [Bacilli bacterium]MDD7314345.1 tRNA (adenosine(37)-N6)-threonylcarbamoyltransferase complex transferase subunit TsaD [Bacilli bacterium]MDY4052863.1 tRNA (adenosine(37)-N6)-threonylcarbamoyltransferase complex transferase subunit TsaD [Bacilli bacterium]
MIILGIESSCDETSVAIVEDGKKVYSNVIYTQIEIHKQYGGVVPEVASRHHIEKITFVIGEALKEANMTYEDIDKIAVTAEPGLIGSLMVGINAAKTIGLVYHKPVIMVNHIHGHIYANYLESDFSFPLLALVVSGGHTELVLMKDHYQFEVLGETLDDAVGEAYDKVARVVEVGYPGGPILDKMAAQGEATYQLPRIKLSNDSYDFSFSGLKSAVINLHHKAMQKGETLNYNNLAASFQQAVVDVLVYKTKKATLEYNVKQVIIAGGVAANKGLRNRMKEEMDNLGIKLTVPAFKYCTDNAAMIAVAGYFKDKVEGPFNL